MSLNQVRSIVSQIDKGKDLFGDLLEYGIDICLLCPEEDFGYCGLRDEDDSTRIKQCRKSLDLTLRHMGLDTKITRKHKEG